MKYILFAFLLFCCSNAYSQNAKPYYQSHDSLDFTKYLSGVKSAYLVVNDDYASYVKHNPEGVHALALLGMLDYLKAIGFPNASWGTHHNTPLLTPSVCDLVKVIMNWGYTEDIINDISMSFISCNSDTFQFVAEKVIWNNPLTYYRKAFYRSFLSAYGYKRNINPKNRLKLPVEMTEWNEEKLKAHFLANGIDRFEGIYEGAIKTSTIPKYKLAVLKSQGGYQLIYLGGANNQEDWEEGEMLGKLNATSSSILFKANWRMMNKVENNGAYVSFEEGFMSLLLQEQEKSIYLKIFPTTEDEVNERNVVKSGTGFGLALTGLIVTNSHVVHGARKINIKGIQGDFIKTYTAKILVEDKNNDLAILQITDSGFVSLGEIPFTIAPKSADVGSPVYALGYPMKALMGDEIKLTNGIISAKSGFKGDVSSYQISVPLQPGNSGGPLFDVDGNLVGIVNAKLVSGENVSYAVKVAYLTHLLELLPNYPKLQTVNSLKGKQLPDQVKVLHKFVYLIEVNN